MPFFFSLKLNSLILIAHDLTIPLLGIYQQMLTYVHQNTCVSVFVEQYSDSQQLETIQMFNSQLDN